MILTFCFICFIDNSSNSKNNGAEMDTGHSSPYPTQSTSLQAQLNPTHRTST